MAFPLIRLISLIIYGILIVYQLALYSKNTHSGRLVFLFWLCALFFRTFTELGYHLSSSFPQAVVWWRLDISGPFITVLWLHYILTYISMLQEREIAGYEKKIVIFAYFSAVIFFLLEMLTNWITKEPARASVGYRHQINAGTVSGIMAAVWIFLIGSYSVYLIIHTIVHFGRQDRSLYIELFCVLILQIFSMVFDLFLPLLQVSTMEIVNVALVGMALLLSIRQFRGRKLRIAD